MLQHMKLSCNRRASWGHCGLIQQELTHKLLSQNSSSMSKDITSLSLQASQWAPLFQLIFSSLLLKALVSERCAHKSATDLLQLFPKEELCFNMVENLVWFAICECMAIAAPDTYILPVSPQKRLLLSQRGWLVMAAVCLFCHGQRMSVLYVVIQYNGVRMGLVFCLAPLATYDGKQCVEVTHPYHSKRVKKKLHSS